MKKEKRFRDRRSFTFKERFDYWFDNKVVKGSLGLIRVLIMISVLLAVLVAEIIIICRFNEDGEIASVFWDSIATLINAWMPSYGDGSLGYLLLMTLSAIAGVLFTSVLIGIITNAIEEKIDNLKRGNSLVLESGHVVVLGFYPGEYTLLNQLVLAAAGAPACIVVAEDMEREVMEQSIRENLNITKNIRLVCRTVDITDPVSLEKCSVDTCKTVIISPTDNMRTIKAVLAVSTLLEEKGAPEISVNAIVSKAAHRFLPSIKEANNITTLQTREILAKMIAHSCTQTGLSGAFREVFNFEGSEFYLVDIDGIDGLSFEDLTTRLNKAVPVGVFRTGQITMNPPADYSLKGNDRVLVFSEGKDHIDLQAATALPPVTAKAPTMSAEDDTDTVFIGHNETLPTILKELPLNVTHVYLAEQDTSPAERDALEQAAKERNLLLHYFQCNPQSEAALLELAQRAEHIVILNDHDRDPEEADMEAIFLLMNLREIRKRYDLHFNITVEMQKEHNQKLVGGGDNTDYIVASSMSSLILAQLAESPELISVFREILSNEGNEIFLKNVGLMQLEGSYSIRELRRIMLNRGYVLIGDLDGMKNATFNRGLDETICLTGDDDLIVIGEE